MLYYSILTTVVLRILEVSKLNLPFAHLDIIFKDGCVHLLELIHIHTDILFKIYFHIFHIAKIDL